MLIENKKVFKWSKKAKQKMAKKKTKYDLKNLKIGESYEHIFTQEERENYDKRRKISASLPNCARHMTLKHGYNRQFVSRTIKENNKHIAIKVVRIK